MENILAKKEKVDFCTHEFNKRAANVLEHLKGVDNSRSKYKSLYPFDYTKHVEINKEVMHYDIDELIDHLKYMKEKIRHDETYLDKR